MFAINPLLLLAGIVLYVIGAAIRDHFRYKSNAQKPSVLSNPHTLEVHKDSQASRQNQKAA